jgi:hypothetical protein
MPLMLIVVINSYAQRIESVDIAVVKDSKDGNAITSMLDRLDLGRFDTMYLSLETLFKRLRPAKQKPMFSTPPQQTTVPANPIYSGGSMNSADTSSSTESKPELYAQDVAKDFVKATYVSIRRWLVGMEWANPEARLYLSSQYVYKFIILTAVLAEV